MSLFLLPSQKETAGGSGAPCQPTRGMVAAAHGSVKPPNPLGEPKRVGKCGIYSALPRVSRPGDGDTADVNHLLIWMSAALGACVVLLAVLAATLKRHGGRRAERVADVVRVLERRMDELMDELARAVERAEEGGRRSRFLVQIPAAIELAV